MKTPRALLLLLSLTLAGGIAFAMEPVPWDHKDHASEFKYLREGSPFTAERWAALIPEEQERLLQEARQPAFERQEAMKAYYKAAMAKWNGPTLRDYAAKTKDADIEAVRLWLGEQEAAAFSEKLALTRALLKKAGTKGLGDEDALLLGPHLLPKAIEELRLIKFAAERHEKQAAGEAPKAPASRSTASLDKFAGPDPSKLGAANFSKLYDNMSASGADPAPVIRGQSTAGAARPVAPPAAASVQPKRSAFAMPEVAPAPRAAAAPPAGTRSAGLTSDAYGVTVYTAGGQQPLTFRKGEEAVAAIRRMPDGSITRIIFYGHGGPGLQSVGPFDVDADSAGDILKGKMARGGVVQFAGCNTSSIGGMTLNPAVGLSMVARRLLYFSLPYFQDRAAGMPAEQARDQWGRNWNADLARDTSLNLRGAVVCGYRTFGLVPGRLPGVTAIIGNQEATTPGYVAGKKACYQDGREVPAR